MSFIPRTNTSVTLAIAERTAQPIIAECAKLERELAAARAEIARLNGQTRWQCACGGTDCAGQKENETLRAEVSQLRAALELGQINCDAVYSDMQLDRERVMDELAKLRKDVQFVIDHAGKTHETECGDVHCNEFWMAEQLGAALDAQKGKQ